MKLMHSCQELSRLLSDGQDQKLRPADRARMRLHLVMCEACRTVDEQMRFMREAMRRLGQQEGEDDSKGVPPINPDEPPPHT